MYPHPQTDRWRELVILLAYAAISAVYLLYLPHALPVLDDWMYLQRFEQARAGGLDHQFTFLRSLLDNSWLAQFRIFWASQLPVFALSLVAGFTAWPYFLLAWTAHLLSAVLLRRLVLLLAGDDWIAFAAGAVYAVFPPANNALFWSVSNCIYYIQTLCLLWWLCLTWKKLGDCDFLYHWRDLALLLPVAFSGEQILPALVLLPPLAWVLFGERELRGQFLRFWLAHAAVLTTLLGLYSVFINRMPIARGFENRYVAGGSWTLRPAALHLLGSLGWKPDFAGWRAEWRPEWPLPALLALGLAAFWWGSRRSAAPPAPAAARLLLWSLAGLVLSYLPVATLTSFEWRYLYVSAPFLALAAAAACGAIPHRARTAVAALAVVYGLSQSYFEMRQCWIPQSRVARGIIEAVTHAPAVEAHEVIIVSGAPIVRGVAADFITGASWSMQSMLEHYTRAEHVQGARDLVINERGELALHRRDSLRPFHRQDLGRLRVFARDASDRFRPKSLLALPVAGHRFELLPLRGASTPALPARAFTLEELKALPAFDDIYFPRHISSTMHSSDI
jgi:hypothetical protein